MTNNVLNTFYQETNELLLSLEDSLLIMEQDPKQKTAMDSAFRSIHTIKGSSGTFGFDHIEKFAHHVEHLLDGIRHQEIELNDSVIALLLECKDHLEQLVKAVALGNSPNRTLSSTGQALIIEIQQISETGEKDKHVVSTSGSDENSPVAEMPIDLDHANNPNWHISLRFAPDIMQRGMDPISILQYLSKLGKLENVVTLWNKLPPLQELDPQTCYPGLELEFSSDASREEIESAFQFIRDDCLVCLVPPYAPLEYYASLAQQLPESAMEVSNILLECGALDQIRADRLLSLSAPNKNLVRLENETKLDIENPVNEEFVEIAQPDSLEKPAAAVSATNRDSINSGDTDKLDSLINLVGELVISGATTRLLAQQVGNEDLLESISRMGRLIEEIRDSVLNRRMIEIGEIFHLFDVLIDEANRENDKSVIMEVNGADTELEKSIVEKISEPLTRLLKSILDCFETQKARVLAEKHPTGKLSLNAFHDSGSIVIELLNDGPGLPVDEMTKFAIDNGLIDKDHLHAQTDIFRIALDNNFPTTDFSKSIANHILTIQQVRKNIESLRGTLKVEVLESGMTLIGIRLPLTLAIIDGFLVSVGKSSYVIPLDMVLECVELEQVEKHIDKSQSYINLRGEVLPFIRLREWFKETKTGKTRENIVVVEYGQVRAGLVVDDLLGEVQTVIKPLGKILQNLKGINGATILGSGHVAVILDVPNLIQRAAFNLTKSGSGAESIH